MPEVLHEIPANRARNGIKHQCTGLSLGPVQHQHQEQKVAFVHQQREVQAHAVTSCHLFGRGPGKVKGREGQTGAMDSVCSIQHIYPPMDDTACQHSGHMKR